MGCGKIGDKDQFNHLKLLKERLIQKSIKDPSNSEKCKVPQSLEKVQLEALVLKPMDIQGLSMTDKNIENSSKYLIDEYTYLKSCIFSLYESFHSECIKNFRITDGLIILLISIAASNKGSLPVTFRMSPPYIQLKNRNLSIESKKLYECWVIFETKMQELAESHVGIFVKLKEISNIGNDLEKVFDVLDKEEYKQDLDIENNIKLVGQGVLLAEKICEEVKNVHGLIQEFIKNIKAGIAEIERYGKAAAEINAHRADDIVHSILPIEVFSDLQANG